MRADALWAKVEEIYHATLGRPADQRASYLRERCAGNEILRREVESLLGYDQEAQAFLEPPGSVLTGGQSLGCYRVISKLGAGGMGEVYLAEDTRLGRRVALKVLPREFAVNPARKSRLMREARSASGLNHPNIITVYDIGCEDGTDFIAMEYVEGKTLEELIAHKGLGLSDALNYARQIAGALEKAHGAGLVHRDLKPSNIMLTCDGLIKILDFGLAKLVLGGEAGATATRTQEGTIAGTVGYMSPEQTEGRPLDARSDVFSFGAVLYEMITGRRAFLRDTPFSTIAAILREEPVAVTGLAPGIPPDLEKIIVRCLRKDPERRFQHMDDVRIALMEIQEEIDYAGHPQRDNASAGKRTWLWALPAMAVLTIILGLWLARQQGASMPPQRVVQLTALAGSEISPSISPDGKQVAFSWDGANPGVYVKLLGDANALQLTSGPDVFPAWDPDGKRLAFVRGKPNTGIYTVSALGGAPRKIAGVFPTSPMSWSADGKWLAVSLGSELDRKVDRGIVLVAPDDGALRRITNPQAPAMDTSPAFAPDGKRLAYGRCSSAYSCDVNVQDLAPDYSPRGTPEPVTHQNIAIWNGLTWSRDGAAIIYAASHGPSVGSDLWQVKADGRQAPRQLGMAGPMAYFPSASRTADRLVFEKSLQDNDVWCYRASGGTEPLIRSSLEDANAQFSPDGTRIAFESGRSGKDVEIWISEADGSKPTQITDLAGSGLGGGTPRWSPDGRWIAFDAMGKDGSWDIWAMEADGSSPRRITSYPSDENIPSWSRDGKWIYFTSDRTGRWEIWRVLFAGGEPEQVTAAGGSTAFESVDGKSLFYTKADLGPLFVKRFAGGGEEELLPFINLRSFIPAADGIYYIGMPANARNHTQQLLRFPEDIINLLPTTTSFPARYPLEFFQFSNGRSKLLVEIEGGLSFGLSVSPDRKTILFTKSASLGADVMMIENFR